MITCKQRDNNAKCLVVIVLMPTTWTAPAPSTSWLVRLLKNYTITNVSIAHNNTLRCSAGTNVHFQHLKVLLLKRTNVRIQLIMENSLENYVLTYIMTLSVLTLQEKYGHSITVQVKI